MSVQIACRNCGTVFTRRQSQASAKFCSYSCKGRFQGPPPSGAKVAIAKFKATAESRFWARVDRSDPQQCWEWTRYRNANGYGVVSWNARIMLAHRVALSLYDGDWESSLHVLHRCDNPACCNVAHLWRGTDRDNSDDKMRKGRDRKAIGAANRRAKVTAQMVADIRASTKTQKELALQYGVSKSAICHIKANRVWRHVE